MTGGTAMDLSTGKHKLDESRVGPFLTILMTFKVWARRLVGFFVLTEEERLEAGVYVRGKGLDE
jgi:hypothetical protein